MFVIFYSIRRIALNLNHFGFLKNLQGGGGCSVPLAITSDNVFYAILKKIINIGFEMIQNISGDGEGNQAKKSWFGGSEYQVSDYLYIVYTVDI